MPMIHMHLYNVYEYMLFSPSLSLFFLLKKSLKVFNLMKFL